MKIFLLVKSRKPEKNYYLTSVRTDVKPASMSVRIYIITLLTFINFYYFSDVVYNV